MSQTSKKNNIIIGLAICIIAFIVSAIFVPHTVSSQDNNRRQIDKIHMDNNVVLGTSTEIVIDEPKVVHVTTPKAVKSLYISSWVGGTKSLRDKIIADIEATEANAVVLDIKDYTGMVSYMPQSPEVQANGCIEERIKDIDDLFTELHNKNIYIIGRVAVFQDPCAVKKWPDQAVKRKSDGAVWKDRKGISWMDAGSPVVWDYNIAIAKDAYKSGFDEINFDYIRYPSDGNMIDIAFPVSGTKNKQEVLESFFAYVDIQLRGGKAIGVKKVIDNPLDTQATGGNATSSSATKIAKGYSPASDPAFDELVRTYGLDVGTTTASTPDTSLDGTRVETTISTAPRMVISADLFGMVTNNTDDLGIGQVLERIAPYVDFIGPMVYPSHYPQNFIGYSNPAEHPYQIVRHAMQGGVEKLKAINLNPLKLRPWIQDFNLGATYTADMVRKQIQATYDSGLTGWMLWDASNTYTPGGALKIDNKTVSTL